MCVGAHTINTRLYKYRISVTCDNHMQVYHIMEVVSNGKYLLHCHNHAVGFKQVYHMTRSSLLRVQWESTCYIVIMQLV